MIASISGTLRVRDAGQVVVETGGVGYMKFSFRCRHNTGCRRSAVLRVLIRQIVREDALLLYELQ